MRILILGGDGYLGWPMAMHFAVRGHDVTVVDNYLRRTIAKETDSEALIEGPNLKVRTDIFKAYFNKNINVIIGDCADMNFMCRVVQDTAPETIIHFAEQPSAPYSMMGQDQASKTFHNNLGVTFNLIWAVINYAPDTHIVKLGTMGEYGTPNIDIEEGWIKVEHNGREQEFLYPRQAGSLYHTTKVLDTDLLWFYVRMYGLRVTDLMQGPVYGIFTDESVVDERLLPNFHYDDIFGTIVNRFICQAVAGIPLTVFGKGGQTRGYLNLKDTMQCIDLAAAKPADKGELRIYNQFTEQFSVNQLADKIKKAAAEKNIHVEIKSVPNPRIELEDHYYNAKHTGLVELGLEPTLMTQDVLSELIHTVIPRKHQISEERALPRVRWSKN
jgi:UDP-sulfoquinovose synthase